MMKIALCGPPHSGKSVLRERLKAEIRRISPNVYPLFITANPDGEGSWFQETYQIDPELAREFKVSARRSPSGWSGERRGRVRADHGERARGDWAKQGLRRAGAQVRAVRGAA